MFAIAEERDFEIKINEDDFRFHVEISGLKSLFCACAMEKIGVAQGKKVN